MDNYLVRGKIRDRISTWLRSSGIGIAIGSEKVKIGGCIMDAAKGGLAGVETLAEGTGGAIVLVAEGGEVVGEQRR